MSSTPPHRNRHYLWARLLRAIALWLLVIIWGTASTLVAWRLLPAGHSLAHEQWPRFVLEEMEDLKADETEEDMDEVEVSSADVVNKRGQLTRLDVEVSKPMLLPSSISAPTFLRPLLLALISRIVGYSYNIGTRQYPGTPPPLDYARPRWHQVVAGPQEWMNVQRNEGVEWRIEEVKDNEPMPPFHSRLLVHDPVVESVQGRKAAWKPLLLTPGIHTLRHSSDVAPAAERDTDYAEGTVHFGKAVYHSKISSLLESLGDSVMAELLATFVIVPCHASKLSHLEDLRKTLSSIRRAERLWRGSSARPEETKIDPDSAQELYEDVSEDLSRAAETAEPETPEGLDEDRADSVRTPGTRSFDPDMASSSSVAATDGTGAPGSDSLSRALVMIVVDDGSPPSPSGYTDDIARLCERYGATLVRHSICRGAAAARNTGMDIVDTMVRNVWRRWADAPGNVSWRVDEFEDGGGWGGGWTEVSVGAVPNEWRRKTTAEVALVDCGVRVTKGWYERVAGADCGQRRNSVSALIFDRSRNGVESLRRSSAELSESTTEVAAKTGVSGEGEHHITIKDAERGVETETGLSTPSQLLPRPAKANLFDLGDSTGKRRRSQEEPSAQVLPSIPRPLSGHHVSTVHGKRTSFMSPRSSRLVPPSLSKASIDTTLLPSIKKRRSSAEPSPGFHLPTRWLGSARSRSKSSPSPTPASTSTSANLSTAAKNSADEMPGAAPEMVLPARETSWVETSDSLIPETYDIARARDEPTKVRNLVLSEETLPESGQDDTPKSALVAKLLLVEDEGIGENEVAVIPVKRSTAKGKNVRPSGREQTAVALKDDKEDQSYTDSATEASGCMLKSSFAEAEEDAAIEEEKKSLQLRLRQLKSSLSSVPEAMAPSTASTAKGNESKALSAPHVASFQIPPLPPTRLIGGVTYPMHGQDLFSEYHLRNGTLMPRLTFDNSNGAGHEFVGKQERERLRFVFAPTCNLLVSRYIVLAADETPLEGLQQQPFHSLRFNESFPGAGFEDVELFLRVHSTGMASASEVCPVMLGFHEFEQFLPEDPWRSLLLLCNRFERYGRYSRLIETLCPGYYLMWLKSGSGIVRESL
ncbi:hypothetical protein HDU96_008760 [Phlyctochytrium bullatum]|nr:hypothetical protein HDU96_008760 [Phlyctochytrium bullatum]